MLSLAVDAVAPCAERNVQPSMKKGRLFLRTTPTSRPVLISLMI